MSLLEDVLLRGLRADQPDPTDVSVGSLYYVTDESVLEQSNGSAWVSYSAAVVTGGITQLTGDVTAGPGSGSQASTIANLAVTTGKIAANAVTDAKLRQSAAVSIIGRSANSTGDVADIAAGGNDTLLRRVANALDFGQLTVGMFPASVVTYAKIQDVSATSRALGRKTAGSGVIEELTLSELLDFIGSAAQGDILFRDAAAWARLAAGTSGHYLKTQGAGANPTWAAVAAGSGAWTLIEARVPTTVQEENFVTNVGNYSELLMCGQLVTVSTTSVIRGRYSTDGGSSWKSASGDYKSIQHTGAETNATDIEVCSSNVSTARSWALHIVNSNGTTNPKFFNPLDNNGSPVVMTGRLNTTSAINGIQMRVNTGTFTAGGSFYLFGKS